MVQSKWLRWLLVGIPVLILLGTALGKLVGTEQTVQAFTTMGLAAYVTLIGVLEVVIAILFLIPVTRNVGFFLVCSYLGGAIVAHLSHNQPFTVPMIVLVLVWGVIFLTKPSLFLPERTI